MTPDVRSLSESANVWDVAGYIFSAFVLIGAILEAVELFKHIRAGKGREKAVEIIAFLILIVGLLGQVYSAIKANEYNSLVIAKLNEEAARADDDAAKANEVTAKLVSANLQLQLEIQGQAEYLRGRQLTKRQYDEIQSLKGKLKAILILTEPHCPECLNFVGQLANAFAHAGLQVELSMPNLFIGTGLGRLCVYDSPDDDLVEQALQNAGLPAGNCGNLALPFFGILNPDRPVVGVGEQQWFSSPQNAYLGPPSAQKQQ